MGKLHAMQGWFLAKLTAALLMLWRHAWYACRCSHDYAPNWPGAACPSDASTYWPWLPARSNLVLPAHSCSGGASPSTLVKGEPCSAAGDLTSLLARAPAEPAVMLTSTANMLARELTVAEEMAAENLARSHRHVLSALHILHTAHQTVLAGAQAECQSVLHLMPTLRFGRA